MKKYLSSLRNIQKPKKQEIIDAITSFSYTQKIFFVVVLGVAFASAVGIIATYTLRPFQYEVAIQGGHHTEGIVGTPRFVNPVLSVSPADRDVEQLVFSGLTRKTREGSVILDLAEDFEVSDDNLIYTFTIAEDARFHDNTPITARDVVFTIQQIQNPEIKSPKRVQWEGISAQVVDDTTVRFILSQPFIGFLENMSTGIIPAHIWEPLSSEEFQFSPYNIEPIGSGPYMVQNLTTAANGTVSSYSLKKFKRYIGTQPFIQRITLTFFENQDDALRSLRNREIDALALIQIPELSALPRNSTVYTATLNRMFGIFFNQDKNSALQDRRVRQAIDLAIDRQAIIREALKGFGEPIKSPLSSTIQTNLPDREQIEQNITRAENLLDQSGWTKNSNGTRQKDGVALRFTLHTAGTFELQTAATMIQSQLQNIGIDIEVETLNMTDFNQNIVRPRNFELVLLGQTLNQEADIFAFWHSSQTSDPGLNISNYKNTTVDRSLEQIIQTFDTAARAQQYTRFEQEFFKDIPAIFIYSPQVMYVVRNTLKNVELSPITNSSQRLVNIYDWYIETNFTFQGTSLQN